MFWLDVDLRAQTVTLHRGDCVHISPKASEGKGVNEMRADGGWFSFNSAGEAMRFDKMKRLSGDVNSCLLCRPLEHIDGVEAARLDVKTPKTGCDACGTPVDVIDTKSTYKRIIGKLLGER